jgi:DNA-binding CsgD family transcriptional regulator
MPATAPLSMQPAAVRQRLWQELDLLCRLGLGLAPIAPDVCAVLRALVGADAAALFWLDAHGMPEGFFHEDSPTAVQDLFLNEFERLFVGGHEINVFALARPDGPRVGRLLAPGARYFRTNSYNLLVRASGHHHALDLRIEVQGRTRAVLLLFRAPGRGFDAAEAALLERASASLQRAFGPAASHALDSRPDGGTGHVVLDASGQRPMLADATALALLQGARLRGLGMLQAGAALPPDLARRLNVQPGGASHIPVPRGLLLAQAHALLAPTGATAQWLITLQLQRPRQIDVVRRVLALPLSPLQREIAALAGLGHARAEASARTGVGEAALKKHMRAILEAAGAGDWQELSTRLRE